MTTVSARCTRPFKRVASGVPTSANTNRPRPSQPDRTAPQCGISGSGTILFTTDTAFITLNPERAGVGVSFPGAVAYAEMLLAPLAEHGIHVAHTAVNGRSAPGIPDSPAHRSPRSPIRTSSCLTRDTLRVWPA